MNEPINDDEEIIDDDELDEEEDEDEGGEGKKDKEPETPEAKRARLTRELKRHNKKHGFSEDDEGSKPKPKPKEKKGTETLDRIDKAVLRTEKITEQDEIELVETFMKETGKTVEQVLGSKFFQAELEELRETSKTRGATPKGSKRATQSSSDSVDYWIKKGELPPKDTQPELRRKVVNAKIEAKKNTHKFSGDPIV